MARMIGPKAARATRATLRILAQWVVDGYRAAFYVMAGVSEVAAALALPLRPDRTDPAHQQVPAAVDAG
jgi:hypothetical protein